MNIILQDQVDDAPIRFTTPIPLLRNQAILVTPVISVITTPYSSQCFLSMNSPMLSSKLTALEIKMCGKIMVVTSYFKNELQSLKKYYYASNFIQILNISSKHWYLVFRGKLRHISICDPFVTNGKYPKTLLKVYLASQIFTALFFNCVFFKFSSKKIILIAEYLLLLM